MLLLQMFYSEIAATNWVVVTVAASIECTYLQTMVTIIISNECAKLALN